MAIIGEAWVALRPETTNFGTELRTKLAAAIGAQGPGLQSAMNKVGLGVIGGVAAVGAISVKLGESLQKTQAAIAANADISVGAAAKITSAFQSTAFQSIFSAQQMGTAYSTVAGKLGELAGHALSAKEALGFMKSASDLAEASGSDLGAATNTLAAIMQTFQVRLQDTGKTADQLFSTSRLTGVPLDQLGSTMTRLRSKTGETLGGVGDLGAALVDLAQHGVTGSRGLLVVNQAVQAMVEPGAKATQQQKDLSKSLFDSQGRFEGFRALVTRLSTAMHGMTQQQQFAYLQQVGLSGSAKALMDVINGGPAAFDKAAAAVNKQAAAHEAAEKRSQTFHAEMEKLKAGLIDTGEKIGSALIPKIMDLGKVIGDVIGWFEKHKAIAEALAAVLGTVLAVAAVSAVVNAVRGMISAVAESVTSLFTWGGSAVAASTTASTSMEASLAEISAAVTGIAEQMGVAVETASASMEETAAAADVAGEGMTVALGPVGIILLAVAAIALLVATHWKEVSRVAVEVGRTVFNALSTAFNWVKEHWPLLLAILGGPFGLAVYEIVKHFAEIKSAILGFVSDAEKWLLDTGKKIIGGLVTGIKDIAKIYDFFYVELPQKILGFLVDAGKWLLDVGENIVKGLRDGIMNGVHWIVDAVKHIGDKIKDEITSGFGIFSPSRVFHGYGQNMMEGLALGIAQNAHLPQIAVHNITLAPARVPGLGPLAPFSAGGPGTPTAQLLNVLQQLTNETRTNTEAVRQQTNQSRQPQTVRIQHPVNSTSPIAALASGLAR